MARGSGDPTGYASAADVKAQVEMMRLAMKPGQGFMSVTDQYLYRAGVSQVVPKVRGMALSLGLRGEGVPIAALAIFASLL